MRARRAIATLLVSVLAACAARATDVPRDPATEAAPASDAAPDADVPDADVPDAVSAAAAPSFDAAGLGAPCDPRADLVDDGGEATSVCEGGTSCFDFQRFDGGGYCTTTGGACAAVTCPADSRGCAATGSGIVGCR